MGITLESFQALGIRPVLMLILKISQRIGETVRSVLFSMRLVMPSTPAADVLSSFLMKEQISLLEQLQCDVREEQLYTGGGVSIPRESLKHSEKN
jgi:hypothetical protein